MNYKPYIPKRLSKSMIETYAFCPMQYKVRYQMGVKQPATHAMTLGTRFHDFADTFFDVCDNIPCDMWLGLIPEEFNDLERGMAEWFVERERDRFLLTLSNNDLQFKPFMKEDHLISKVMFTHGYVDRVDINSIKNKTFTVVEYKTGIGHNDTSLRRQMCLYGMMIEEMYPEYKCTNYLCINPRLRELTSYKDHANTRRSVKGWVKKMWDSIDNDDFPRDCSERKWLACGACNIFDVEDIINERSY